MNPKLTGLSRPMTTIALLAGIVMILLINPVGFIGGGQDDGRYLEAARCWVAHGPCVPVNHWQGRWPVFAPIALFTSLLGESRLSVQIWAFLCSVTATLLFAEVARRLFDERTALLAGILLIVTPAFSLQLLTPSAEAVELGFAFAGVISVLLWRDCPRIRYAFIAGIFFGLAAQVRETAVLAAILVFGAIYFSGNRPSFAHLLWSLIGFIFPFLVEFLIYSAATGDPFLRRRLSLHHGLIPSTELDSNVDRSKPPILNPDFIAGWKREPGIRLHWIIDGPLNLIFNAKAGYSMLLGPLLLILFKDEIPYKLRRSAWRLLSLGAIYVILVTYLLAMDPKPRVMTVMWASGALALAAVISSLWNTSRRAIAVASTVAPTLGGLIVLSTYIRPSWGTRHVSEWAREYPNAIETDPETRRMFTLSHEANRLADLKSSKDYLMTISVMSCQDWILASGLNHRTIKVQDQRPIVWQPEKTGAPIYLCLLKYLTPISSAQAQSAVNQARKSMP